MPKLGWHLEEIWPAEGGLVAQLKNGKMNLTLDSEFRASVLTLRRD
jgi:hypothetical protein